MWPDARRLGPVAAVLVPLLVLAAVVAWRPSAPDAERSRLVPAAADAYVSTAHADSNYGEAGVLRMDRKPQLVGLLRFELGDPLREVRSAAVRLRLVSGDGAALRVRPVVGGSWHEGRVTSRTAPRLGAPIEALPDVQNGWVTLDVTALAQGRAVVQLALASASDRTVAVQSREGSQGPELALREGAQLRPPAPSPDLRSIVEDVPGATAARYGVRDDAGGSMDGLKVVPAPGGGYLGTYHTDSDGLLVARVATSDDLLTWTRRAVLDEHASQPTLQVLGDGGVLVALEADTNGSPAPRTWLRLMHYPDVGALLAGRPDRSFDVPHTQVPEASGAEGTPQIAHVRLGPDLASSSIEVAFHYLSDGGVDRQARGVLTDFTSWTAWPEPEVDEVLTSAGFTGHIGDRDSLELGGRRQVLLEARRTADGPWSTLLYDPAVRRVTPLQIRTAGGSTAFANPTVTWLRAPSGAPAVLVTLFLPASGAAPGEAGELVYYAETGPRPAGGDPVVVAAGDISCALLRDPPSPGDCRQGDTASLVEQLAPTAVLALGDLQYERGTLSQFLDSYDASWGRFRNITLPSPGNHEYQTPGARGYFDYFGAAAGRRGEGWYSRDIGSWHVVSLNSNCSDVDCGPDSPQLRWLRQDLAEHRNRCVLALWHEPRFSSGSHRGAREVAPFWDALHEAGADVVLNGHDHNYERFARQDPAGRADPRGLRQFVVGTGGKRERDVRRDRADNSEVAASGSFGVLRLDLHPDGYDWEFVGTPGSALTDRGSDSCS